MNLTNSIPESAAILPSDKIDQKALDEIAANEKELVELKTAVEYQEAKIRVLKREYVTNTRVPWKDASIYCLEVDAHNPYFFLKSAMSVSNCIARKYKLESTRDLKNKVSTTLSTLFNQDKIGKYSTNGSSYYGLLKFFKEDNLTMLKDEYIEKVNQLRAVEYK